MNNSDYSRTRKSHKDPIQSTGTGHYKLYGKTFSFIPAYYPGLEVRQLEHAGRIVLDQVINDPPPYWFVTLLNARADDQALLRKHFGPRFGGGRILGSRRFVSLAEATAYFEVLCQIQKFAAEIEKARKVKEDRKGRLAVHQATLKMYSTPPVKPKSDPKISPIQKRNETRRDKAAGNGVAFLDRETFDPPERSTGLLEGSVSGPEGSQS
jgi:hypothetical protein